MRQALADKISSGFLDWRDAESVHMFEFNFPAVPHSQGNRKGSNTPVKARSKSFQQMVIEIAEETLTHKCTENSIGARLVFVQTKKSGDLDNFEKAILDALKNVAFGDDKLFDYIEKQRVRADIPEDVCFVVEILKTSPKRGASWL
jgi:Holliday junction resolvase RusA-like endonuclease